MKKSNIALKSNIMLEGREKLERACPGDFAALIFPSRMRDSRVRKIYFSERQIWEYLQTVSCLTCGRPCAGTCASDKD